MYISSNFSQSSSFHAISKRIFESSLYSQPETVENACQLAAVLVLASNVSSHELILASPI